MAGTETDYGAYFQYGQNIAYTYDTGTDPPANPATSWTAANDPCPTGWHVPTKAEYDTLLTASTETWGAKSGINGATVTSSGGSLFFPAAGTRAGWRGERGPYWSSLSYTEGYAWHFDFTSTYAYMNGAATTFAFPIRCVRPAQ
jgi:uncharacterized protein (TIGR02145 family)